MGMRERDTIDVELDFLHYAVVVDRTRAHVDWVDALGSYSTLFGF